ncbi:glycogen synthase [uncultured Thiodictyon sp.]|uniref:glycogen synthase n=1 Tax=uncultured Thiodictyon sp. TaxID=1846217 RepID=UPI0025D7A8F9|nr:glycogen synthase [uncultured Thiodictyon sp.]
MAKKPTTSDKNATAARRETGSSTATPPPATTTPAVPSVTLPPAAPVAAATQPPSGTPAPKPTPPATRAPASVSVKTKPTRGETPSAKTAPGEPPPPATPAAPATAAAPTPPAAPPVATRAPDPAAPVAKPVPASAEPASPPVAEPFAEPLVEPGAVAVATAAAPTPGAQPQSGYQPEPDPHPAPPPVYHEPRPSLYIVHITPEMAPVAKVGGLADVVFGISREHAIRGNHVEIILPKYANLRYDHIFELHEVYRDLWVPWYTGAIHCTVFFGFVHDRKCFFIEPHSQENFFNRGSIYGFADDVLRFAFFSRAAIEFLWKAGKHPDIIHCHDWQTALVPVFLYEIYQQLGMTHPRACLTIHNFMHQGQTGAELLRATGLNQPERFFDYLRMGDNQHKGALNLLKAGIVYSNFITTVSQRYSFETKDQGQGFGLEPTLHTHHMKYGGVLNGIDYDVWNPEVDTAIPVRYGVDHIDGKYDNKRALRHRLMLADNDKPIVSFIGRLDPQKGLELVRHAIFYALERGSQFVLLGASPDQSINNDFWALKRMLNDSPDCHLEIGFDEDLAHLIYAGADIMLVPSQFEPCGLTQLIALRYGTVPVVRTVGGLADTVFDKDHSDRPLDQRNGYRFDHYDRPGLESALGRAIDCYYQYPEHFRELMKNGMRADYSWNHPGQDYLNIYDFIRAR